MDLEVQQEEDEDLYTKLKTLQRQLEFYEIQVPFAMLPSTRMRCLYPIVPMSMSRPVDEGCQPGTGSQQLHLACVTLLAALLHACTTDQEQIGWYGEPEERATELQQPAGGTAQRHTESASP